MIDMPWQEIVFSIGSFAFFIALLPSILSTEKPALWTSVMTAAFITLFAYAFFTLDLLYSAAGQALVALGWWILAYQAFVKRKKPKVDPEVSSV